MSFEILAGCSKNTNTFAQSYVDPDYFDYTDALPQSLNQLRLEANFSLSDHFKLNISGETGEAFKITGSPDTLGLNSWWTSSQTAQTGLRYSFDINRLSNGNFKLSSAFGPHIRYDYVYAGVEITKEDGPDYYGETVRYQRIYDEISGTTSAGISGNLNANIDGLLIGVHAGAGLPIMTIDNPDPKMSLSAGINIGWSFFDDINF